VPRGSADLDRAAAPNNPCMKLVSNTLVGLVIGIKTLLAVGLLGSLSTDRGGPEEAA